jgi:hypothetical protein
VKEKERRWPESQRGWRKEEGREAGRKKGKEKAGCPRRGD